MHVVFCFVSLCGEFVCAAGAIEGDDMQVMGRSDPGVPAPIRLERFSFYERSRDAYAVAMTGEMRT